MITPNDAKKPTPSAVATAKVAETRIDKGLAEGNRTFAIRLFPTLKMEHLLELLDRYRSSGWRVKIVYDQRDGDFIQFEG